MPKRKRIGELEEFMEYLFWFVDRVIGTLNKRYIALFNTLKNLKDEKEIIEQVSEVYTKVDNITRECLLVIAKKLYKELVCFYDLEEDANFITELWLLKLLEAYDPVTKYVYVHEIDRKRARLIEAMIASEDKAKEVDSGLKAIAKQARQYADNVVEEVIEDTFKDNDIEEVIWETERDTRVCVICEDRQGEIYKLDDVPPKPHYGCRCWVRPLEKT